MKATITALENLRSPREVAELRGLTVAQVLGLENKKPAENGNGDTPASEEAAAAPAPAEAS